MKLEGEFTFNAAREKMWEILNDTEILRKHMPGCETLEEVAPDSYEAVMTIGVASIKGTYRAKLRISEKTPPESYRMEVDGSGKPGFVKGSGTVSLTENGASTILRYEGDLQVGGADRPGRTAHHWHGHRKNDPGVLSESGQGSRSLSLNSSQTKTDQKVWCSILKKHVKAARRRQSGTRGLVYGQVVAVDGIADLPGDRLHFRRQPAGAGTDSGH